MHWTRLLLLCVTFLGLAQAGWAAKHAAVKDDVLFSESARRQADEAAREIQDRFGVRVFVEAYREAPLSLFALLQKKKVQAMNPQERQAFFADLARKQVKARFPRSAKNYVYVLICLEPAPVNIDVQVGPGVRSSISTHDADALAALVREKLAAKTNDAALLDGLALVSRTLAEHADALPAPTAHIDWLGLAWVLGPIVAVWLLCEVFRRMHPELRRAGISAALGSARGGSYPVALFATIQSGDLKQLLHALAGIRVRRPLLRPRPNHADSLDHDFSSHVVTVDVEPSGKVHGEP